MTNISMEETRLVLADPRFVELAVARARLRWGLSFVVLAMFFGLIILMASAPSALAQPLGPAGVTLGMALALALFIAIVALTGFYVHRSNTRFDSLMHAVRNEVAR